MLTGRFPAQLRQRVLVRLLAGKRPLWICVHTVLVAVIATSAAGCGSAVQGYSGPVRPAEETAVLRPVGLTIDAIGSFSSFWIASDHQVSPGMQTVKTHYKQGAYYGAYYQYVSFMAEAGHVYCLAAKVTSKDRQLYWEPVVFEQHQMPIWLAGSDRKRCNPEDSGEVSFPDGRIEVRVAEWRRDSVGW